MVVALATRIRTLPISNNFRTVPRRNFFLSQTQNMVDIRATSKRPTCPTCTKPAWLCLCSRLNTPELENSVSVTILQHSLEKKHPLNSTRIALLGLKNVTVATVSDVNLDARFVIWLLDSKPEMGSFYKSNGMAFDKVLGVRDTQKLVFEECNGTSAGEENVNGLGCEVFAKCPKEKNISLIDSDGKCSFGSDISGSENAQNQIEGLGFEKKGGLSSCSGTVFEAEDELALETSHEQLVKQRNRVEIPADTKFNAVSDKSKLPNLDSDPIEHVRRGKEGPVITATIGKQGVISYLSHVWTLQNHHEKPSFNKILDTHTARDVLAKGFIVQKLQKQQQWGSLELEEYMEFEIKVPPGSVLLFPTEDAVSVDRLKAINFEVKNLIVLDGTWAKAKRMYAENPWLKLLPHLKLELDKVSLYNGVRMQPKAGCLSTIESIVYTLKEVGDDNLEGLDSLLDVFESMVGDQKRCKEKRLREASEF
ncbi:DTW [Trema orientale]|uniref:tRNA-uridine aminocarboxypropyltransferase n=1 Tax=Trema orientale TaxID=63057 RepID=A0A2P5FRE3_TREOI|nr:DTW [Trema orientale]